MVYRPPFIKQLDGSRYAGLNCTCASLAMLLIRHWRGANPPGSAAWYPTPKGIRAMTGDTSGGTNLSQMDLVANRYYATNLDVRYRLSWDSFPKMIKEGRGAILQGSYSVFHKTKYDASGGTFTGNHAVYINEISSDGHHFLMYDPLADGRRSGIYRGPAWIDGYTLKRFAGALLVGRTRLGFGLVFAGFSRDTEPTTGSTSTVIAPVYRYGGKPYGPKLLTASVDGARVRPEPSTARRVGTLYTLRKGQQFAAYQRTIGQYVQGSNVWYGSRRGREWIHSSVVIGD